jgi:predicted HTH transcriptional regulator
MKFHQFLELLEEGEGLHVEFKRRVSTEEKIAHEMIAFANTSGGVIMVGIDDDKSIVGVGSEKEEISYIEEAAQFLCAPPILYSIDIFGVKGRDVVCVNIPESRTKPHFLITGDGEEPVAYIRVGEHSVQASREMVKVLQHQSTEKGINIIIGDAERRLFAYLDSNDRITVKEYAKLINVSDRRASRLLIRLVRAGILAIHTNERADFFTQMQTL